jgi:hypothetical protein
MFCRSRGLRESHRRARVTVPPSGARVLLASPRRLLQPRQSMRSCPSGSPPSTRAHATGRAGFINSTTRSDALATGSNAFVACASSRPESGRSVAISLPRALSRIGRRGFGSKETRCFQRAWEERMMGLEPTTFCMANVRDVARERPGSRYTCGILALATRPGRRATTCAFAVDSRGFGHQTDASAQSQRLSVRRESHASRRKV